MSIKSFLIEKISFAHVIISERLMCNTASSVHSLHTFERQEMIFNQEKSRQTHKMKDISNLSDLEEEVEER